MVCIWFYVHIQGCLFALPCLPALVLPVLLTISTCISEYKEYTNFMETMGLFNPL